MVKSTNMSAIVELMGTGHKITIEHVSEKMCKGQDETWDGTFVDEETGETGRWGMVTDGHGTDKCIRFLRSISKSEMNGFVGRKDPVGALFEHVNLYAGVYAGECSGSTLCLIKVYKDRVVCINCGDSQAVVYKNGCMEFISVEHNCLNPKEKDRLAAKYGDMLYRPSGNIELVSPVRMIGSYTEYACFPNTNMQLAVTQALGHRGVTGYAADVTVIPYDPQDDVRVIIGSDGFWDMTMRKNEAEMASLANMPCHELLNFALGRWLQEWEMQTNLESESVEISSYTRSQCDDVGIVKIDIVPITEMV